jgi:dTMP kinase
VVREINEAGLGGIVPDRVFVLEVDPDTALGRQHRPDRIGSESVDFQRAVRSAYRDLAAADPRRVVLLDGSAPVDELAEQVMRSLECLTTLAG